MTYLHRCYSAALQKLKEGKLAQGVDQIESILSHEFMADTDMENLKYSALMSLANINEQMQQYPNALSKYWQALQILTNKSMNALQQGMFNLRQFNEERPHSEFTILLKMLAITEREKMTEQTIYILKRTITISPSIWRQNLILKLRDIYQK
jgi:tetratricopeptide (TPR) repeat protein